MHTMIEVDHLVAMEDPGGLVVTGADGSMMRFPTYWYETETTVIRIADDTIRKHGLAFMEFLARKVGGRVTAYRVLPHQ